MKYKEGVNRRAAEEVQKYAEIFTTKAQRTRRVGWVAIDEGGRDWLLFRDYFTVVESHKYG